MSQLKEFLPVIKKALFANALLLFYFLSPTFISFCVALLIFSLCFFDEPAETIAKIVQEIQPENEECVLIKINQLSKSFNKMTLLMQILLMVMIKIGNDIMWFFPTWVLMVMAVELYVGYEVLKKLEMNEKIENGVKQAREKIDGLANLIPRYKE